MSSESVRADFVPSSDYISRKFLELENERVWPRVWLMACREEELASPGAYVVFDVVRDSILTEQMSSIHAHANAETIQNENTMLADCL